MGYLRPTTLSEVFDGLEAGASIIAGGTDWFPARGEQMHVPAMLDITELPEFAGIACSEAGWRIGASETWSNVLRTPLPSAFDGLKAAAREVGSVQIQNAGTIVGNLCNASPAADGVPPLLTLDASVELVSRGGVRQVALAEFITGVRRTDLREGEVVSAIVGPPVPQVAHSRFFKLGARDYLVISIAMVGFQARVIDGRLQDVRIAVGACGPVAMRLPELEQKLTGCGGRPVIDVADLGALSPIDDVRGSAAFRREAVAESLSRIVDEVLHG